MERVTFKWNDKGECEYIIDSEGKWMLSHIPEIRYVNPQPIDIDYINMKINGLEEYSIYLP